MRMNTEKVTRWTQVDSFFCEATALQDDSPKHLTWIEWADQEGVG